MEYESDSDTNCNLHTWYSHQRTGTETRRFGNKRTSVDHPNYSIVEISQNTEKSPGDLKRLAVTQTPVKKPSVNTGVKNYQKRNNISLLFLSNNFFLEFRYIPILFFQKQSFLLLC